MSRCRRSGWSARWSSDKRRERGRGVEPTPDEVPQHAAHLVVGQMSAVVEAHLDQRREEVVPRLRPTGGRLRTELSEHGRDVGDGRIELGIAGAPSDRGVEERGVALPAVERQPDEVHGEDRRHRVGEVTHEVQAAGLDPFVDEPRRHPLHQRLHADDGVGHEERVHHPAQRRVSGTFHLGDARGRDRPRPRDPRDAQVPDPVLGLARVLARERLPIAGHRRDLLVAADHPEPPKARVEGHGTSRAQRRPLSVPVLMEVRAVVVELGDRTLGHVPPPADVGVRLVAVPLGFGRGPRVARPGRHRHRCHPRHRAAGRPRSRGRGLSRAGLRPRRGRGARARAEIVDGGGRAAAAAVDVTDPDAAGALVDACVRTLGRLDVLVNNAGTATPKPLEQLTDADWRDEHGDQLPGGSPSVGGRRSRDVRRRLGPDGAHRVGERSRA